MIRKQFSGWHRKSFVVMIVSERANVKAIKMVDKIANWGAKRIIRPTLDCLSSRVDTEKSLTRMENVESLLIRASPRSQASSSRELFVLFAILTSGLLLDLSDFLFAQQQRRFVSHFENIPREVNQVNTNLIRIRNGTEMRLSEDTIPQLTGRKLRRNCEALRKIRKKIQKVFGDLKIICLAQIKQ